MRISSSTAERLIVLLAIIASGCVYSATAINIRRRVREQPIDTPQVSSARSGSQSVPALSNFASEKDEQKSNSAPGKIEESKATMDQGGQETATTAAVHKLLNVPINNGTGTVFLNINLHKMMEDPYVHGVVLPAAVGMIVALLTLLLVCSIRSCVRSQARKRRKRRIRNLAEELKADQKVLLTADSDDEI